MKIREQLRRVRQYDQLNEQNEENGKDYELVNNKQEEIENDFQEKIDSTIESMKDQISQLMKISTVNVSDTSVEVRGTIIQHNIDFIFSVKDGGPYIMTDMTELEEDSLGIIQNLYKFQTVFTQSFAEFVTAD